MRNRSLNFVDDNKCIRLFENFNFLGWEIGVRRCVWWYKCHFLKETCSTKAHFTLKFYAILYVVSVVYTSAFSHKFWLIELPKQFKAAEALLSLN